jgi:hypothetical protein
VGGGGKPHFLHTFCREEYRGIYRGVMFVLWPKVGPRGPLVRPVGQLEWPGSQVSWPHQLWALDTSCTNLP